MVDLASYRGQAPSRHAARRWRRRTVTITTTLLIGFGPVPATLGQVNVGVMGGAGLGVEDGVLGAGGVVSSELGLNTRFKNGVAYGLGLGYRFPGKLGFSLEVQAERLGLDLVEEDQNFGTLRLSLVLLLLKFQGKPEASGFTGHFQIGAGVARSERFEDGSAIVALERQFRGDVVVETKDQVLAVDLGLGLDFFFSRNIALTADIRVVTMPRIETSWRVARGPISVPVPGAEEFLANHLQALVGLRIWAR